jgi:hypothetical protein
VFYLELNDINDPKEFDRVRLQIEHAHQQAIQKK